MGIEDGLVLQDPSIDIQQAVKDSIARTDAASQPERHQNTAAGSLDQPHAAPEMPQHSDTASGSSKQPTGKLLKLLACKLVMTD